MAHDQRYAKFKMEIRKEREEQLYESHSEFSEQEDQDHLLDYNKDLDAKAFKKSMKA